MNRRDGRRLHDDPCRRRPSRPGITGMLLRPVRQRRALLLRRGLWRRAGQAARHGDGDDLQRLRCSTTPGQAAYQPPNYEGCQNNRGTDACPRFAAWRARPAMKSTGLTRPLPIEISRKGACRRKVGPSTGSGQALRRPGPASPQVADARQGRDVRQYLSRSSWMRVPRPSRRLPRASAARARKRDCPFPVPRDSVNRPAFCYNLWGRVFRACAEGLTANHIPINGGSR